MSLSMNWSQLLSADRLGLTKRAVVDPSRSAFQIDSDRIIFSSAFRRLQDKTQVFPLADNDYVRTRLTHSLEVASVARSLGARVGAEICRKYAIEDCFHASDVGAIVSAAALAHDLGNPPFGHSGEDAIRHWFKTSAIALEARAQLTLEQKADIERFEGNAQGFRLITRLQMPDNPGLRLTCATLGAFTKYPRASRLAPEVDLCGASTKKYGFFQSELPFFQEVAERTGLIQRHPGVPWWTRHPLVFLVEAADDICYRLVDFEDGFRLKHLSYEEVRESFLRITGDPKDPERADRMEDEKEKIAFLRAKAIGSAVEQCATLFREKEEAILRGEWDEPLLEHIPSAVELERIRIRSVETIYATPRGVGIEAAGYEVLGGLLEIFFGSADDVARHGKSASPRSRKMLQLVPTQFLGKDRAPQADPYTRLLRMIDFVSGMTDSYAVSLYKKVRGISLPGQ
ncbi:MAG: deoxyguanosinetriphosphate triphosphohydrolase [Verrucomicrobiaceae bacterium]|nr:MAG: deoxyguanosinetriphosphate triphosphohydrolase [Verrucomicrobiaceae bacterium]